MRIAHLKVITLAVHTALGLHEQWIADVEQAYAANVNAIIQLKQEIITAQLVVAFHQLQAQNVIPFDECGDP